MQRECAETNSRELLSGGCVDNVPDDTSPQSGAEESPTGFRKEKKGTRFQTAIP